MWSRPAWPAATGRRSCSSRPSGPASSPAGSAWMRWAPGPAPAVYPVIPRVAARISTLETPPDVMAVFALPPRPPLAALGGRATSPKAAAPQGTAGPAPSEGALVVYTDGVQDPGNLGTLLRAALGFGATGFATSPVCADPYGPKTLRAGMGAVFGLPLASGVPPQRAGPGAARLHACSAWRRTAARRCAPRRCAARPCSSWAPSARAFPRPPSTTSPSTSPSRWRPGAPGAESLNAGVAGAIALYEFSRRSAGASDDARAAELAPPAKG